MKTFRLLPTMVLALMTLSFTGMGFADGAAANKMDVDANQAITTNGGMDSTTKPNVEMNQDTTMPDSHNGDMHQIPSGDHNKGLSDGANMSQ